LVDSEKFRFDFSSKRAMTVEEIDATVKVVSDVVHKNFPVYTQLAPLTAAMEIQGLESVF
jgi:alanyl-tRNA synthetase